MSAGKLGSNKSTGVGTYNVYQVPPDTYAKVVVSVCAEISGSAKIKLFVSPTSTPANIHTIQIENVTTVSSGFDRTALILKAGEWVSFYTDSSDITVSVNGVEYPSNASEISTQSLITANGEYLLYTASEDKVAAVNVGLSGVNTLSTDSCSCKLYISTTNASGGTLIVNSTIGGFNTGYEKTGVVLKSGEKIIAVISGMTGNISSRVQGFERNE